MIALYKGKTIEGNWYRTSSRLICWFTFSEYSHSSFIHNGIEYEADIHGVVVHPFKLQKGRIVDLYDVRLTKTESEFICMEFEKEKGAPYDFRGLFGFLLRREVEDPNKWFCSEIIANKFALLGKPLLLRLPSWQTFPSHLSYSHRLKPKETLVGI
jgi:hypothetical protein